MGFSKLKNAMLSIANNATSTKLKKAAMVGAGALMIGIANTNAVLVSGSGVTLETADLTVVSNATQSYATTSLEVFKLLGFIVIIWGVKYIISKVLGLFGGNSNG